MIAMIPRRGHPLAGIEAEDLELDSSQPGDMAGYVANIHEPGAGRNAELDHSHGLQTLRLGELRGLEKAERILLPHDQIEGDFCFVATEERDKIERMFRCSGSGNRS